MTRKAGLLALLLACAAALPADAGDRDPGDRPPPLLDAAPLPAPLAAAVRRAVATLRDPPSAIEADQAVRLLAGVGPAAVPEVVAGLAGASWRARAALVLALAEMDAPGATPLLVEAARDVSFAVREAAVTGLGKTGDARGAEALVAAADAGREPIWRVRVAAAAALRRGVLRGTVPRAAGEAALVALLGDPDPDVRRAALAAVAPLAVPAALPPLLAIYGDQRTRSSDRTAALDALRVYREPSPELREALRRGFLEGASPAEAVQAGCALLAIDGAAALEDPALSMTALRHLMDESAGAMRDGIVRLGGAAAPWLRAQAERIAGRVASGREMHDETPFDMLVATLVLVDETAGIAFLRDMLTGADAETLDRETRLSALRKVRFAFPARMRAELRELYGSKAGADLRPEVLRAVFASGGEDLPGILAAALGHHERGVRSAALELLDQYHDLPAPPRLAELAEEAADPRERLQALESLSRRDPEAAARLAAAMLADPLPEFRYHALRLLANAPDPARFDALVARLDEERGQAAEPPVPVRPSSAGLPRSVTPSAADAVEARERRRLRAALVRAIAVTDPGRAHELLLRLAAEEPDAPVREVALRELRPLIDAGDAARLVELAAREPDASVTLEILRTLALLPECPEAVAQFETLLGDARRRLDALRLLREPGSRLAPPALEAGLDDERWTDEERQAALVALVRVGRGPGPQGLARLVRDARTLELASEALRALRDGGEEAEAALVGLAQEVRDPERLGLVVETLGHLGTPAATEPLLRLFERAQEPALTSVYRSDPAVELYRQCAAALGTSGDERAGRALVEHLLDPRLAALGARASVLRAGPFRPTESAPVTLIRTLCAAVGHFDEPLLGRLVEEALARRAEDGRDLALDEGYVEGVARYLHDPLAHDLPARRRPGAALPLFRLVPRIAPRMTQLDLDGLSAAAAELESLGRFEEALAMRRAHGALADVEDAARTEEQRRYERGYLRMLEARAAAAAGRADEALALARSVREEDASDPDLAYLQGYALVRIGLPGPEAEESLRFTIAREARNPRAHYWLGWIVEQADGSERALPHYREAVTLDVRRVLDSRGEYLTHRRGRSHTWGHYPYWLARALLAAGRAEEAATMLADAVRLDDRFAAQALADPAFAGRPGTAEIVERAKAEIPDRVAR